MLRVWAILACIAGIALVAAPAQASRATKRADKRLGRSIKGLVRLEGGPPGAIAVVQRGRRKKVFRAGRADVNRRRRIRTTDYMRLASVTKAYTGAVALSLVTSGRLQLDDTVGEHVTGLPASWSPVTLRQLMQHTSGIPTYTDDPRFQADLQADPRRSFTRRQILAYVTDEPLAFAPGSRYEYSNTDNILVGLIAEAVTGRSYQSLLRMRIVDRLDLRRTYLPTGFRLRSPFMHGYGVVQGMAPEDVSTALSASGVWASGAIVASPRDLNRFIRAYVAGRLFGRGARRQQLRFRAGSSEPRGPGRNASGLSIFRYRAGCGTVYGHSGNFPGYTQFAVATRSGRRSATISISKQLFQGSTGRDAAIFRALRRTFGRAVCAARAR